MHRKYLHLYVTLHTMVSYADFDLAIRLDTPEPKTRFLPVESTVRSTLYLLFIITLFSPIGVVKVVATAIFIFFGVETLGRRWSLFISAMGMGTLFFIIGAILKTHPPPAVSATQAAPNPPPASKAMAALLYIYVTFYSMGWGE
jgi:hypothetical protein